MDTTQASQPNPNSGRGDDPNVTNNDGGCAPGTICISMFSQDRIKNLTAEDFALDTTEKLSIRWKDCMIVLFYGQNSESRDISKIFSLASQQVIGPVMAACNLFYERKVAEAFTNAEMNLDDPQHWVGITGYPFIIAYRKGRPQGYYNGDRSVEAIVDYSLTLACQSTYFEKFSLISGVQSDNRFQMGPSKLYPPVDSDGNSKLRTQSFEYKTGVPIRGYNETIPISKQGSSLESAEQNFLGQQSTQPVQPENITPVAPPNINIPPAVGDIGNQ